MALTRLDTDRLPTTGHFWLIDTHNDAESGGSAKARRPRQPATTPRRDTDPINGSAIGTPATPTGRLVGGINLTTPTDRQWSLAHACIAKVRCELTDWSANPPLSVEAVLRDDRHGVDLILEAPRGIPLKEWSLDIRYALRNLSLALDALAPATSASAAPNRHSARQVAGQIPAKRRQPLETLCPVGPETSGAASLVPFVRDLHRAATERDILTATIELRPTRAQGFLEYESGRIRAFPTMEMRTNVTVDDGAVIGTIHTHEPVHIVGRLFTRLRTKIRIAHGGELYDPLPLLEYLVVETRRHLDLLA